MRNGMKVHVEITRLELCDLLLACTHAKYEANDGGEKWKKLHDKLCDQLNEFDAELDEYRKFIEMVNS